MKRLNSSILGGDKTIRVFADHYPSRVCMVFRVTLKVDSGPVPIGRYPPALNHFNCVLFRQVCACV